VLEWLPLPRALSRARSLWTCSLPADDPKPFCYAAFEHPQLESPDGRSIAIAYSTNTLDLTSMARHPNVYWPRLLTVDLTNTHF